MNISDKIRELRIKKGLTQKELAIKSNISQNSIFNYENGKRDPTTKVLEQIANALGISVMYFLDDTKFTIDEEKRENEVSMNITDMNFKLYLELYLQDKGLNRSAAINKADEIFKIVNVIIDNVEESNN